MPTAKCNGLNIGCFHTEQRQHCPSLSINTFFTTTPLFHVELHRSMISNHSAEFHLGRSNSSGARFWCHRHCVAMVSPQTISSLNWRENRRNLARRFPRHPYSDERRENSRNPTCCRFSGDTHSHGLAHAPATRTAVMIVAVNQRRITQNVRT